MRRRVGRKSHGRSSPAIPVSLLCRGADHFRVTDVQHHRAVDTMTVTLFRAEERATSLPSDGTAMNR